MTKPSAILSLNAGSSSIKFSVYEVGKGSLQPLYSGLMDNVMVSPIFTVKENATEITLKETGHKATLAFLLDWLNTHLDSHHITAVGHRIVHGGTHYTTPVKITPEVISALEELIPLAPLHQPHNIAAIKAVTELYPELPQIACFDTAFHATQPPLARMFALPREYTKGGMIRYGFHGLSYEYIASVLPSHIGDAAHGRVVIAHLGNGASMCAMKEGKSIATTMGFTALDGLMMGTRTGAIDPGVLLYFLEQKGMTVQELNDLLYKKSGLSGVSGISHDMRTLEASNTSEASEAIELFCYRAAREMGSLITTLGGLDALVFTAGIGQKSMKVRQTIAGYFNWLGIRIDTSLNASHAIAIHHADSKVKVLVIPTDEELVIAQHTARLASI